MKRKVFLYSLAFALGFTANVCFAEVTWEPDVRLTNDSYSSETSFGRTIAADSKNRVHAVWFDQRDGNWEIYYKRSLNEGQTWDSDVRLTENSAYSYEPSIATDSNNWIHVVWIDMRNGNGEIYYKSSSDGGGNWGDDVRLTSDSSSSYSPSIAVDPENRIHIVWEDFRDGNSEIYYKQSEDGGQSWGSDIRLTWDDAFSIFPEISTNSSNQVHIVWQDYRGGLNNIYYKRSFDGGKTWGVDVRLTMNNSSSSTPSIATNAQNGIHVVWIEGGAEYIYYRRSLDGGDTWENEVRLTNTAGDNVPSITIDLNNRVHVVWGNALTYYVLPGDIYYKRSTDGGNTWEDNVQLTNDSSSIRPSITTDSQDELHVVWTYDRDGWGEEIYYKRGTQEPSCRHSSIRPVAPMTSLPGQGADPIKNFDARPSTNGARHFLMNDDGYLSAPSSEPPSVIALEFLKHHHDLFGLSENELATLETQSYQTQHNGVTHLNLRQTHRGLSIFGAQVKVNVDAEGRILSIGGELYPRIDRALEPTVSATEALVIAAHDVAPGIHLQPTILSTDSTGEQTTVFEKGPLNTTDAFHAASLTVFPMQKESRLAWQVILHKNSAERYLMLIDANTGELLYRTNLVTSSQPQGLVFEEDPDDAGQVLMPFLGDPAASPSGWLYQDGGAYSSLGGNNTCTQEDRNDDNISGYSPNAFDGHFQYPFQDAYQTSGGVDITTDLDAALANLFYHVNVVHDYFYALGFDEAAGNFQTNNFTHGGLGNDEVHADAQDAWDTGARNNANFYTPPDGDNPIYGKPRMQMYLFTQPPYRNADGDFDGKVIVHEYTHGLSNRLVGGPDNVWALGGIQSEAMGEGWGDWFASSMYNDPVVGEYVTGDAARGIRRFPLDSNPLTYADVCSGPNGCEVHDDGEIWSAALWDLRDKFIEQYGFDNGKKQAEQLVVDGMTFSPVSPSMLDMRNAIVNADLAIGGLNQEIIWQSFACRGMGFSAATVDHNDQNPVEAFDLPDGRTCGQPKSCLGTGSFRLGGAVKDASGVGIPGVTMTLTGPNSCEDSLTTIPQGYAFQNLGAGMYTVAPAKVNCNFLPEGRTVTVNKRNNVASFRGSCTP